MEDYKRLLGDFDRWTGKGNLIQANQTASKLFRLILEGIEARGGKQMLTEAEQPKPVVLTRGDKAIIANELDWEDVPRVPSGAVPPPVNVPSVFEETVTPAEAIAVVAAKPAVPPKLKPAAKKPVKKD